MLQTILNYLGVAVFASSGATVGVRKGFDLFGIAALGVVTGVGGGVLRDVLLDIMPPTSIQNWPNITISLIAVAIATPLAHLVVRMNTAVLVLDAIGMGVLATSSAAIAVDAGASWFAAGLIGMVASIAGGVVRDVLANEVPLVMGPDELYAVPALLGAGTYVAIDYVGPQWVAIMVGSTVATALRLAGMAFHWRLPTGPRALINPAPGSTE
ncbi:trimeric intracellular cation channel family protein [Mycobacterium sp. 3519A]|uniref:trimeric intracellular cation channel family protein n=1 Tax=Mycobacterium sp. 3519A TaxID=2057184 RepID=UPI000C7CA44E|nr:trimeric intracellular cation channel family protein [Mycobacterium sp. 3519A]